MKSATFVSVWDGGYIVESGCKIDLNGVIHDIEVIEDDVWLEHLDCEYVTIEGVRFDIRCDESNNYFIITLT